jgi:hypothetical protein
MNFRQWIESKRQSNRFQNLDDRVRYGKGIETNILQALQSHGWEIKPVSSKADKYDKIDGVIQSAPISLPVALPAFLQVKYRDTGNDLLMEVVWEYTGNFAGNIEDLLTGRDMRGKAQIYANLNQEGSLIRIRSAYEAKDICKQLLFGRTLSMLGVMKSVFSKTQEMAALKSMRF